MSYSLWEPIWNYVCAVCSDILSDEEQEQGGYQLLVSKAKANQLWKRLEQDFNNGATLAYLHEGLDQTGTLPFSIPMFKAFLEFVKHSGGFDIG